MIDTNKLKDDLLKKNHKPPVPWELGLDSGSTLVNLACTGNPNIAFFPGHFYMLVGASRAGKTWLLLQILAEAARNRVYRKHRLIMDKPERGSLMDVPRYFGGRLAKRLEAPGGGSSSRTIEEFYDHVDDAIKEGEPFIYGLDSEDALSSEDEQKKAEQNKKARRKNKKESNEEENGEEVKIKGSYGDGKAKKNSAGLRQAHSGLEETDPGSMIFMIKQARDNPAAGPFGGDKQTRSGGRSLTYYSSLELWFNINKKITDHILGRDRIIGSMLKITVKKNRVDGWEGSVEVPFYRSYGIDDIESCINFLLLEKHWKKKSGSISAPEFDFAGKLQALVHHIEEQEAEQELRLLTGKVWQKIERACSLQRKTRYS